jgi:hypothetical protein
MLKHGWNMLLNSGKSTCPSESKIYEETKESHPAFSRKSASGALFSNLIDGEAVVKKSEMYLAGVGFSVEKGESIAKDGKYSREGRVVEFQHNVPLYIGLSP